MICAPRDDRDLHVVCDGKMGDGMGVLRFVGKWLKRLFKWTVYLLMGLWVLAALFLVADRLYTSTEYQEFIGDYEMRRGSGDRARSRLAREQRQARDQAAQQGGAESDMEGGNE